MHQNPTDTSQIGAQYSGFFNEVFRGHWQLLQRMTSEYVQESDITTIIRPIEARKVIDAWWQIGTLNYNKKIFILYYISFKYIKVQFQIN
ncbi:unnamed protein product [Larinioides sclopetarius]|uniref:Uncharacterized protein n=1 Tax=Larinioides sclopetarius TaxID=280406 RepID=A0AAV1YUY3_9ARAC